MTSGSAARISATSRANQVGLAGVAVVGASSISAAAGRRRTATMKMRSRVGVEARRLEIELQPAQLVEREIAKVGAARRDQVLLLGRQHQDLFAAILELAHVRRAVRRAAARRRASTAAVSVPRSRRTRRSAARRGRRARAR